MASVWGELKRRNVVKVAVAYAIVGWLLIEVASVLLPTFQAPEWVMRVFSFFILMGFPIALILSWAYELTPEGIKTTKSVEPADSITKVTGRKLDFAIIGALVLALGFVVYNYVLDEPPSSGVVGEIRRSIAVLPFDNRSNDENDAFFVDGIHDDILTQLAKISSLKVISRTSVMIYRDTTKNMKTIGEELGVATLLEGGVQRAGDRVRISVQLIDTNTDEHLWAESYNRELTAANIFEIQEQMATEIAAALRATLSPKEQERLKIVPTENMAAMETYFRGKQHMEKRGSENLTMAVNDFQQAIALDPNFALAYVGLADAHTVQNVYDGLSWDERGEIIEDFINQALALDDELGEAYTSLGNLKYRTLDWAGAEPYFKRALELSPNYAVAYQRYGNLMRVQRRFDEALTLYRNGIELDPHSVIINRNMGISLSGLGRFDEVLAQFEKVIEVAPTSPLGYRLKGIYYWWVEGRLDEAVRWYRQATNIDLNTPLFNSDHALLLLDLGDDSQAECWANHTREVAPDSYRSYFPMMFHNLYRGDETQAVEYANKVLTSSAPLFRYVRTRALAVLRNHDLGLGNVAAARDRYARNYPEYLGEARLKIDYRNLRAAIDLAKVLQETGEQVRADGLLNGALAYVQNTPRLGWFGYGFSDVAIYALQGETEKALNALRQAIDAGWRRYWRYTLEIDPNLDSIRNEPAFQAMVEEVRADVASQLARVREMEPIGKICVAP